MSKVVNGIIKFTEFLVCTIGGVMVIILFANIVCRFFKIPLAWSEELSRFMLIWFVFLGSFLAIINNEHLGLDIVIKAVPPNIAKIMYVLVDILVLIAIGVFTYGGVQITLNSIGWISPALAIDYALVYVIVPISGVGMFIRVFVSLVEHSKQLVQKEVN